MTCRFDWYSATIDAPPLVIVEACMDQIEGAASVEHTRGRFGYQSAIKVLNGDRETLATVLSGGQNGPPNATATGSRAERFADIIRAAWPAAHRVTRLDSAADAAGDFLKISAGVLAFAKERGLKAQSIIPLDPEEGSTVYLGSTASRVRCRVYEKGKQLRAMGHPVTPEQLGIVRLEVQLRPSGDGRATCSAMTPVDAWGATHWTRALAADFIGIDPGRQPTQFKLLTTFERTGEACRQQYGTFLRDLRRRTPNDQAFLMVFDTWLSQ